MSALAPRLEAFFTERLGSAAPGQSPHRCRLSGHLPALVALRLVTFRQGALGARLRRHRRRGGRSLLGAPRARAPQRRGHPQRPAGRDSLLLPLRCLLRARARRPDLPGARHPRETDPTHGRVVPHTGRGRGTAGQSGPNHLARAPGPCAAGHGLPERVARGRTAWTAEPRRRARHRGPRAGPRQGARGPLHTTDRPHGRRVGGLDARAPRRTRQPAVPDDHRQSPQPRRCLGPRRPSTQLAPSIAVRRCRPSGSRLTCCATRAPWRCWPQGWTPR